MADFPCFQCVTSLHGADILLQALAQWDTLKSMDALRLCWALAHIGMLTPPAADTPPTGHAPAQSKALQALAVHAAALLDRLDVQEAYVSSPPSTPPSLMSSQSEAAGLAMDVGHTSAGASSGRGPQQQQQHLKQQRLGRHAAANEQALLLELKLLLTHPHHAAASVPGASVAC